MENFLGKSRSRNFIAGSSSVRKALLKGEVAKVFLARDAEQKITGPLLELASRSGVEIQWVDSMKELGEAMGLRVGAAAAALKKTV